MATAGTTDTLVLTDQHGDYYVIPRALIEKAKVTDEAKKRELKQTVDGGDTTGYVSLGTQAQSFRLGSATLRPLGSCACSWSFGQFGLAR
jgi:hypothetical protein